MARPLAEEATRDSGICLERKYSTRKSYRGQVTMDADLQSSSDESTGSFWGVPLGSNSSNSSSSSSGKKRPRSPLHKEFSFTKAEWKEMNPKLYSLLLPWALLACVAIGSTIATSGWHSMTTDSELMIPSDYEFSSSIAPLWERFLNSDNDMNDEHRQLKHHHHPSLLPLTQSDYWGFFLATLGLMVAAGGGIGGGGILVPIYSLVHGFSAKHAIPLSNITVFGGAVANTILNARKRHPLADRPLVDWDLILVMEPLTIAGALIGAFLNKVLPESLLTIMLVVLLSFTAYTSLTKAIKMYKIESKHLREQGIREDGTKESELTRLAHNQHDEEDLNASESLLEGAALQDSDDVEPEEDKKPKAKVTVTDDEDNEPIEGELLETAASKKAKLDEILEAERHVPMTNIHILVGMFVVVLTINLLKGGGAFASPVGIVCGSASFWIANGVVLLWIVVISLFVRAYLVNQFNIKQRVGYQYVEGDIRWDGRATIVYPCVCCLAGFFAGMFGVGGGIVKGPLMLAMGVHPAVSSASSACMILFTSFTATTSFVVFGLLVHDYAVVCFLLGFVATLVGQVGLSYLMGKSQRNSYIAFSIGGVVLLSAILMTFQSLLSAAEGSNEKSGGICGTS